ncbi:/ / hypothetical protein / 664673:665827 Reverse [Candidatus Hepatoplasma crinochetorum]|uniref:DNA recombination protein RmuC n=1 Tax=Candidatus Hepatoplasma crinochetorum TaxID=295596 RepID=A0A0G7ZMT3_9MOLU|nr:/ / hypothetical protein / 664673:665827 Reverse [Candidatus Hepatoplasma crinochetorum]
MNKKEIIDEINNYLDKSILYRIFNNKKILYKILNDLNKESQTENYYDKFIEIKGENKNLIESYNKINENYIEAKTIWNQKIETIDILKEQKEKLEKEINDLKSKIALIDRDKERLNQDLINQKDINKEMNNKLDLFSEKINKNTENTENLTKLFKGSPASKGKIAEIRLKEIIQNSISNLNLYTFNLKVGTGIVEFAVRAKETDNWIPIDSKFIEPNLDLNQEPIIDQKYKSNVLKRAKEISTKYLDKKITNIFGILVLQNEYIYEKISEDYDFFNEAQKLNIYISSPTTFIQFLRTINTISFNLELLKDVDIFKKDMRILIGNIQNFYNNTEKGIKLLNKAFDNDYKKIDKSSEIVLNKINLINQKQNLIDIEKN